MLAGQMGQKTCGFRTLGSDLSRLLLSLQGRLAEAIEVDPTSSRVPDYNQPSPPPPSAAPPSAANTPLSRPLLLLLQQDGGGEVSIVGDPSAPSAGSRCGWRSLLRFRFGLACPTSGRRRYMPSALFPAGLVAEKRDIVGSYMFFFFFSRFHWAEMRGCISSAFADSGWLGLPFDTFCCRVSYKTDENTL